MIIYSINYISHVLQLAANTRTSSVAKKQAKPRADALAMAWHAQRSNDKSELASEDGRPEPCPALHRKAALPTMPAVDPSI